MTDPAPHSRRLQIFAMFVKGLVRYGWIPLVGVLLIVGLMEWAPWKTLLAIGIAGALVIVFSPMMLGVAGALESRRQRMTQSKSPPPE